MTDSLEQAWLTGHLSGGSMAYVDGLYEDFLQDPSQVPEQWRVFFSTLQLQSKPGQSQVSHRAIQSYFYRQAQRPKVQYASSQTAQGQDLKQASVADLVNAYRANGHLAAKLDPLKLVQRDDVPSLSANHHGLDNADLSKTFYAGKYFSNNKLSLQDIIALLQKTYCGSIGIEYMHIANEQEVDWLQSRMETAKGVYPIDDADKQQLLNELIASEGLERYLGTRYVGQKRFSLEGGDALVPMMNELIRTAGQHQVRELVIGMAHRGRLNVLVNVLGKNPDDLFQEFEGKVNSERTGDVKYHLGYSSDVKTSKQDVVHVALAFNPSHLEIIGPVIQGSARSRLRRRDDLEEKNQVLPVVIHGDAAFAGQGVVMETFNFSQARGYCTGGSVHIVVNNQIGFTTSNPIDARSTLYCTDVAKMVQAPVLHVNADDPEAVLFATQVALEFRMKFKRDIVLDLVCYRRHGHNEADEPSLTQPQMYQTIKAHKTIREQYAKKMIDQGLTTQQAVQQVMDDYRDKLDRSESVVEVTHDDYTGKIAVDWSPFFNTNWDVPADTTITPETVDALSKQLLQLPDGFTLHPVVKRMMAEREKIANGEVDMNWGFAETLAYASLLHEGYGVRLSGQDSGRGTFAHRHAVLHDAKTGESIIPLESVAAQATRSAIIIDSVLSEEAVLAFEYGYASSEPQYLVIWEAQFGDFVNGAQVVIDQFISSGEQKWGRLSGLVMLLPHGYEGQGPEHSSARLERFMQLCAQQNIQVCTPTTPSQIFHLLRRQVIRPYRKPLVIMSPKSVLRHKLAVSPLSDLSDGQFEPIIPEIDDIKPKGVTRLILCGGKVYYDLLDQRRKEGLSHVAIIRIEQLYPFPKELMMKRLKPYQHVKEIVWCQEEPKNQGAWFASQHHILTCLSPKQKLLYAGRGFAASPAVGSATLHAQEQSQLISTALTGTFESI